MKIGELTVERDFLVKGAQVVTREAESLYLPPPASSSASHVSLLNLPPGFTTSLLLRAGNLLPMGIECMA